MSAAEDMKAKAAAARSFGAADKPGVVAVAADEATRLDQRIATKVGGDDAVPPTPGGDASGIQQADPFAADHAPAGNKLTMATPGLGGNHVQVGAVPVGPGAAPPLKNLSNRDLSRAPPNASCLVYVPPKSQDPAARKTEAYGTDLGKVELASPMASSSSPMMEKSGKLLEPTLAQIGAQPSNAKKDDLLLGNKKTLEQANGFAAEPEQAPGIVAPEQGADLEFANEESKDQSLAVAMPVMDEDEGSYIQSAVEYDPDSKPPLFRRRRFRLYGFLALFALISAGLGTVIGVVLSGNNSNSNGSSVPYRETLGIKDRVVRLVGSDELDDTNSSYSKALMWITHNDTMELVPSSSNFVQRYICAYVYFATTEQGNWKSCNPPEGDEPESCLYAKLIGISPVTYQDVEWTRWLSSEHECSWAGLVCDSTQQIRSIDLTGQELTGPFPEGIKHLSFIQAIALSWGGLYGPVPASLVELKHLIDFEVQYNQLSGTIPEEWYGGARNWARLNLGDNNFNGTISSQIGKMEDMRGLYLHDNKFEGSLPSQLGALTALTYFYITKNSLTGSLPPTMSNMVGLEKLWINKNDLSGSLPSEIGKLSRLGELRLRGNPKLGGDLPESFYDLANLWRLDIRGCNFTGTLSSRIGELKELQEFRLADNLFTGPLPSSVKNLQKIHDLQLEATGFTGVIPTELCHEGVVRMEADCKEGNQTEAELGCTCCTLCCNADGLDCSAP